MARELKHWAYYFFFLPLLALLPPSLCRIVIEKIILKFSLKHNYADRKEVVWNNLRMAYPDNLDTEKIAEQNLAWDIMLDAATFKFLFSTPSGRKKFIKVEGRHHLEKALQKGNGVLLLIGHVGSFVSSFWGLGIHGIGFGILANDAPADPEFTRAYRRFARINLRTIAKYSKGPVVSFPLGRDKSAATRAARKVRSLLGQNSPVIAALDVPPHLTTSTEPVRFFDRACVFPSGFVRVAARTGSEVVPYVAAWERPYSHKCAIRFQTPFSLGPDSKENMQACASAVEVMIKSYPDQWFHWVAFNQFLAENSGS